MYLKRKYYLEIIRPYYEVDLIKVITGVRRCGKSVLLKTIQEEIEASGISPDHIIFINLEDLDYEYIKTASDLNADIKARICDDEKYYIFLDEIQHVENFEKALASFRAALNCSLFVTGSNSALLSGELATLLTGRTVEFEILPFSFSEMKEYYELTGRKYSDNLIYDYIKWGGFPLRFEFKDEDSTRRYLENLYTGIVGRDIAYKGSSTDKKTFLDISLYILANAGMEFSAKNIVNYYKSNNKTGTVSERTIYNYIEKMKKAFLIHPVKKYDISGKRALKNNEKFYAVDTGFRIINTNTINYEDTFFLENIVYNELLFQGFQVYIGKTYKGEVDFIAIKGAKKCFIQVTYLMCDGDRPNEAAIEREFGAYKPVSDASPKYVMSLDKIDMSRDGIIHLNIEDFLLHKEKLMLS